MAKAILFDEGLPEGATLANGSIVGSECILNPYGRLEISDGSITTSDVYDVEIDITQDEESQAFLYLNEGSTDKVKIYLKLQQYSALFGYDGTNSVFTQSDNSILDGRTLTSYTLRIIHNVVTGEFEVYLNGLRIVYGTYAYASESVNGNLKIENAHSSKSFAITRIEAKAFISGVSADEVVKGDDVTLFFDDVDATQGASTLIATYNGTDIDVTDSITSWSSTEVSFTVDSQLLPYNVPLLYTMNASTRSGSVTLTMLPDSDKSVVILVDAIRDEVGIHSVLDGSTGDELIYLSQLEYDTNSGLSIANNGVVTYSGNLDQLVFDYRVFSELDNTWSATRSVKISADVSDVIITPPVLNSVVITNQPANGAIEESDPDSKHTFSVTALNVVSARILLEVDQNVWEPVPGQSGLSYIASSADHTYTYSPYNYKFELQGEDGLIVYSETATLTVNNNVIEIPPIIISEHPKDGSFNKDEVGASILFDLSATGQNTIQWQRYEISWVDIAGQTDSSFVASANNYDTLGKHYFRAKLTSDDGEVYSNVATLKVTENTPKPSVIISSQPTDGSIQETLANSRYTFTFVAENYKESIWQVYDGTWKDIAGEINNFYKVKGDNFTSTDTPIPIRAKLTGHDSTITYSNTVELVVEEYVEPVTSVCMMEVEDLPDGEYKVSLYNFETDDELFTGLITIQNELLVKALETDVGTIIGGSLIENIYPAEVGFGLQGVTT